ncbi:SAM-dependent methyltransferase [Chromatium okenii]|uniref:class I SAM-dependent methyltransferase n=1 Tax=Chromatium okenii TaxID=61644 RepID=UPI001906F40D|nr:SAM-dependent methyltransferase [Chromatium okenii]MBK1642520.1 SAM-dependent methyltransferase [Chromatium okenii]
MLTAAAHAQHLSAQLHELLCAEIAAAGGRLPFDAFMELALYAPGLGYYVAGAHKFGAGGDFITAPELSPLFGQCVAAQCAEVLQTLAPPPGAMTNDILEFGAGSGALAVAVLRELERLESVPAHYWIVELSAELAERQRQRLFTELPHLAPRCGWLTTLPAHLRGVVLANEVLDAMPVSRFQIAADGAIAEIFVTTTAGTLMDIAAPVQSPGLATAIAALHAAGLAQAPGYSSEVNLRLAPWLAAVGAMLDAGVVLVSDYGYSRANYYQPDRTSGTLLGYRHHQVSGNLYQHLGLQDLTAHVDFTAVAEAGEAAGFTLAGFTTQAHFLLGCGIDRLLAGAEVTLEQTLAAKQLLLPTAMGERFKVLGLNKNISGEWCGFAVRDLRDRL